MYFLTTEQKLSNLKEILAQKRRKLMNLNKEVVNLQNKISILEDKLSKEGNSNKEEKQTLEKSNFFS